jgi:hypothetical protein
MLGREPLEAGQQGFVTRRHLERSPLRQPSPSALLLRSRRGGFGEVPGARAVNGGDQGRPGKRGGPLAEGMRFEDEVCHLEARSTSGQLGLRMTAANRVPSISAMRMITLAKMVSFRVIWAISMLRDASGIM